jgi:MoxR-like ATPase
VSINATADVPREMTPERFSEVALAIEKELGRVMVGQREVIRLVLMAMIAGGHVLLEGVPGLGKTVLVRSLGGVLHLDFARVQFTPDLMPVPFSPTCCSPTRSTAPRPRRRARSWRRCRSGR